MSQRTFVSRRGVILRGISIKNVVLKLSYVVVWY